MALTTLFNSDENKKTIKAERNPWSNITKTTLVTASLLVTAFVVAVGCSKKAGNTTSSPAQQLSSSMAKPSFEPEPLQATTTAAASVSQPAKPKKIVKRRPPTATYKDSSNGISFQYPRKYTLKTGGEIAKDPGGQSSVQMAFVEPGGTAVATVELPHNLYPETDFTSGSFNVSVNRSLSATQCEQFRLPSHPEDGGLQAGKVRIGGTEFSEVADIGKQSDAKYYHAFENGACYEFALGLGVTGDQAEDGITPVDRAHVFRNLEKILATVKMKAQPSPPEASAGPLGAEDRRQAAK